MKTPHTLDVVQVPATMKGPHRSRAARYALWHATTTTPSTTTAGRSMNTCSLNGPHHALDEYGRPTSTSTRWSRRRPRAPRRPRPRRPSTSTTARPRPRAHRAITRTIESTPHTLDDRSTYRITPRRFGSGTTAHPRRPRPRPHDGVDDHALDDRTTARWSRRPRPRPRPVRRTMESTTTKHPESHPPRIRSNAQHAFRN
jgi:hypothetical protein